MQPDLLQLCASLVGCAVKCELHLKLFPVLRCNVFPLDCLLTGEDEAHAVSLLPGRH